MNIRQPPPEIVLIPEIDVSEKHSQKSKSHGGTIWIVVLAAFLALVLLFAFGILPAVQISLTISPNPDGNAPATNMTNTTPTPETSLTIRTERVLTFVPEATAPTATPTPWMTEGPSPRPLISSTEQTASPPPPI